MGAHFRNRPALMTHKDTDFQEATLKSNQCRLNTTRGDNYRNYTIDFNGNRIKATVSTSGNVTRVFNELHLTIAVSKKPQKINNKNSHTLTA